MCPNMPRSMQRPPLTHGGSQTGSVHPAPLQSEVQEHSFTAMQVPPFSHVGLQDAAWGVGGEVAGLHILQPCTLSSSLPLLTVCTPFNPALSPPPYGLHSVPQPRPQCRHMFPLPHRCLHSNSNLHSFHDLRTH